MSDIDEPTRERPHYSKFPDPTAHRSSRLFCINVNEGWRSWILCTGMYEWAADQLMERLDNPFSPWEHPGEQPGEHPGEHPGEQPHE
jgi:hypothetical protein